MSLRTTGTFQYVDLHNITLQYFPVGGEFTQSVGGVYDISNLDRLGSSEVQQVQIVINGVNELIKLEKCLEEGGSIEDKLPDNVKQQSKE